MLRIRTVFTGVAGSPWYVNMHFDGADSSQAQTAAAAVRAYWATMVSFIGTPILATIDPTAAVIDPATGKQTGQVPVTVTPVQMTATANRMPPANQILVRLKTQSYAGGRQIQGRIFIPGLIRDAADAQGNINPSVQTSVQTATDALIADTGLGVYSKKNGTFTNVPTAQVWNQFAVMRSRRD